MIINLKILCVLENTRFKYMSLLLLNNDYMKFILFVTLLFLLLLHFNLQNQEKFMLVYYF